MNESVKNRLTVVLTIIAGLVFTAAGLYAALNNSFFNGADMIYIKRFTIFVFGIAFTIIGVAAFIALIMSALNKTAYRFLCAGSIINLFGGLAIVALGFGTAACIVGVAINQGGQFQPQLALLSLCFVVAGVYEVAREVITRLKSIKNMR